MLLIFFKKDKIVGILLIVSCSVELLYISNWNECLLTLEWFS